MKKSIILSCLFTLSFPLTINAQSITASKQKIKLTAAYVNLGIETSSLSLSGMGAGIGATFILSNNWGCSFRFSELHRKSKEMPSDYRSGDFLGLRSAKPTDKMEAYTFRVLRVFPTKNKKVRFGLEGGISTIKYTDTHFTKKSNQNIYFIFIPLGSTGNYNSYTTTKNTIGASFKAKVEFPLARWVGLELAASSHINEYQSYVGGEVNLIVGLLRGK